MFTINNPVYSLDVQMYTSYFWSAIELISRLQLKLLMHMAVLDLLRVEDKCDYLSLEVLSTKVKKFDPNETFAEDVTD